MKLSIASPKDKERIALIWKLSFGSSDDFFELFYTKAYPHSRTYIVLEAGEIVSVATIIKSNFVADTPSKGGYLYGVCTHPDHRGKGYAKRVIEYATEEALKWGMEYIVTRPASKELFRFYRSIGFNQTLFRRKLSLPLPSSTEKIATRDLKYNNIVPIRKYFLQKNYFAWDRLYYDYFLGYLNYAKGIALEFHNHRYIIGHPNFEDNTTFDLLELGHPATSILRYPTLYYAENIIKERYPEVEKISLYLPPIAQYSDIEEGEIEEFALVKSDTIIFNSESFFNFSAE